jgi:hypothetical protein
MALAQPSSIISQHTADSVTNDMGLEPTTKEGADEEHAEDAIAKAGDI